MSDTLLNIGLVVVFVLIGGVFAAAEIALVSLRDSQARALASRGRRGRIVAQLNQDPNRFLAAAQVGVTLAGFMSAAFGGATLSVSLAPKLVDAGGARRCRGGHRPGARDDRDLLPLLVFGELARNGSGCSGPSRSPWRSARRSTGSRPSPARSSGSSRAPPTSSSGCSAETRRPSGSRCPERSSVSW